MANNCPLNCNLHHNKSRNWLKRPLKTERRQETLKLSLKQLPTVLKRLLPKLQIKTIPKKLWLSLTLNTKSWSLWPKSTLRIWMTNSMHLRTSCHLTLKKKPLKPVVPAVPQPLQDHGGPLPWRKLNRRHHPNKSTYCILLPTVIFYD